jgi:hypothetical protein
MKDRDPVRGSGLLVTLEAGGLRQGGWWVLGSLLEQRAPEEEERKSTYFGGPRPYIYRNVRRRSWRRILRHSGAVAGPAELLAGRDAGIVGVQYCSLSTSRINRRTLSETYKTLMATTSG